MKRSNLTYIAGILLILLVSKTVIAADIVTDRKKLRIRWERVDGAIEYVVQIADANKRLLINQKGVKTTYFDFYLPPGEYLLRIGAVNRFKVIGSWSDWSDFTIGRFKVDEKKYSAGIGLKISAGTSYNFIFSKWENVYHDSYLNGQLKLGIDFWNMKRLRQRMVNRYLGIDFDIIYAYYISKKFITLKNSTLSNIILGANFYARTNFKIPFNIIFRIGTGASVSIQEYARYFLFITSFGTKTALSIDPILRSGLSFEITFPKLVFLEFGAELTYINLLHSGFNCVRGFVLIGFRI